MKKIISLLCGLFCLFLVVGHSNMSYADCNVSDSEIEGGLDIGTKLNDCLQGSDLVDPGQGRIEVELKAKVVYWTTQLASLLSLLAVGSIVYGGLMMTISGGDDEKIKKGKDIVKWSMLGFLALIAASGIVRLIVEVMFSVAG